MHERTLRWLYPRTRHRIMHGRDILYCHGRSAVDAAFPLHVTARPFWFLVRGGPRLVNSLSMVLSGDQCQIRRGDIS